MAFLSRCFVVSLIGALSACASIHPGQLATESSGERPTELIVSAREVSEYASPSLGMIEITFENRSSDWIRVQSVTLDFGPAANDHVYFPAGAELARWTEAIEQRNAIRDHNAAVAWSAFVGAAAIGAGLTRGTNGAVAGKAFLLAAAAGATANAVDAHRDAAQTASLFPSNHLFAPDLVIPPGLFLRRFVVVQSKDDRSTGYLHRLRLEVETATRIHNLRLEFRHACSSEWQMSLCGPPARRVGLGSLR